MLNMCNLTDVSVDDIATITKIRHVFNASDSISESDRDWLYSIAQRFVTGSVTEYEIENAYHATKELITIIENLGSDVRIEIANISRITGDTTSLTSIRKDLSCEYELFKVTLEKILVVFGAVLNVMDQSKYGDY